MTIADLIDRIELAFTRPFDGAGLEGVHLSDIGIIAACTLGGFYMLVLLGAMIINALDL